MSEMKGVTFESFENRHIGPREGELQEMLQLLGSKTSAEFAARVVPEAIQAPSNVLLPIGPARTEPETLSRARAIFAKNQIWKSYIGMGYYDCYTPGVIQRNILENPGWYTQYTPYQPEISQGRLEALLNFQTMICDLTGLAIANASLLDEGTAVAEAMQLSFSVKDRTGTSSEKPVFLVSDDCFPQTVDVVRNRAWPLGIEVVQCAPEKMAFTPNVFGVLLQYPTASGTVPEYRALIDQAHAAGAIVTVAADILSLTLLTPPGEFGADVVVGSTQRFGVPMGFGGPHAAFFATKDEYKRQMPGRLVGVSKDTRGRPGLRLSLQTREQHIRREKATSNICTAQVLLAVMAGMYAVYHGPKGLTEIATRVHTLTRGLATGLKEVGLTVQNSSFFDTITVKVTGAARDEILARAHTARVNLRTTDANTLGVSIDETTTERDIVDLLKIFGGASTKAFNLGDLASRMAEGTPARLRRSSSFLTHQVFNSYQCETEMLRYIRRLEARDLSLTASMIPLGSCTMKLNATSEMFPVTWREVGGLHPFAPREQAAGYHDMFAELERALQVVTGFPAISLQPNAGSQGEYAGLLVIRRYFEKKGETQRTICLIPKSAHGTNPASAAMAGFDITVVECDAAGNIDVQDLRKKVAETGDRLAALMVTYPSTHGVFEGAIKEICAIVHQQGGQVYMDGANLNAQVGLCRPGDIGADVCHMNLHKTFCIPHGGGGPGMGPIGVAAHLAPYLPSHPIVPNAGPEGIGAISAAPWGSASILVIPWVYISMMGAAGLRRATEVAIVNANYIAQRLEPHFPVLYRGAHGLVAHECILDCRLFKNVGVEVEDIAKRLKDYGFHAPTVSFPVAGTLMVEPTESESKFELDRFCEAMIAIREEIRQIEQGKVPSAASALKNAPHTMADIVDGEWSRPYSRETAAFPSAFTRQHKFWPTVNRIDSIYGDRNLVCSCLQAVS